MQEQYFLEFTDSSLNNYGTVSLSTVYVAWFMKSVLLSNSKMDAFITALAGTNLGRGRSKILLKISRSHFSELYAVLVAPG